MRRSIAFLLFNALVACPLRGQASQIIPSYARDSLAAEERRSPEALRARQRYLELLMAGRQLWKLVNIGEYQLQVHTDCFCVTQDTAPRFFLVTVRNGVIVARAPGRHVDGYPKQMTIDTLFAGIERDLRDPGRVVRKLQLDARYGFPRDYYAETPSIPDLWLH